MITIDNNLIEFINVSPNHHTKNVFFNGTDTLIKVSIEEYMDDRFMRDFEYFAKEYLIADTFNTRIGSQAKSLYIHRQIMTLIGEHYPHLIL